MRAVVLSGSAQPALAAEICAALGITAGARRLERFPDGETRVVVEEPLRGADVYLVQPLAPPADRHLVELLWLADACRRAGAARISAVVPYLAWARQDRRYADGEPHAARLAADLISSRVDLAIAVDVHGTAAEGFFSVPFEHLTAIPALAAVLSRHVRDPVVVAPDLGAAKRAEAFAALLDAPTACVHKTRVSAREVRARLVAGDVAGRAPIVVDDMISTGATIEAAVRALLGAGCRPEVTVAATHGLLVEDATARLGRLGLVRLVVSDSVPVVTSTGLDVEVVPLAPLLAEAIRRLSAGGSLTDLRARA
jgi:ribose-phosphate pyrophosphokinase